MSGVAEDRMPNVDRVREAYDRFRGVALCGEGQREGIRVQLGEAQSASLKGDAGRVRSSLRACYEMAGDGTKGVDAKDVPRSTFELLRTIAEEIGETAAAASLATLMGGESPEEPTVQ